MMLMNGVCRRISKFYIFSLLILFITSCASNDSSSDEFVKKTVIQLPEGTKFLTNGRVFSTRCAGYDRLGGRNKGVNEAQELAKKDAVAANRSLVSSRFTRATQCKTEAMTMECIKNLDTFTQVVSEGFIRKAEKKIIDYPDNIVCVSLIGLVSVPEEVPFAEKDTIATQGTIIESPAVRSDKTSRSKKNENQVRSSTIVGSDKLLVWPLRKVKFDLNESDSSLSSSRQVKVKELRPLKISKVGSLALSEKEIKSTEKEEILTAPSVANVIDSGKAYTIKTKSNVILDVTKIEKQSLLVNGDFNKHYSNGWKLMNGKQRGIKKVETNDDGLFISYKGKGNKKVQWALSQDVAIDTSKPFYFETTFIISEHDDSDVFPTVKLQFIDNHKKVVAENVWTGDRYYESSSKLFRKIVSLGVEQLVRLDSMPFFEQSLDVKDVEKITHLRIVFDVSAPDNERCRVCELKVKSSKVNYL